MKRKTALFVVNGLTGSRIIFLSVLVWVICAGRSYTWETIIWVGLVLTDVFDGRAARRLDAVTTWGGRLDALVDKVVTVVIAPVLWWYRDFPMWAVAAIGLWVASFGVMAFVYYWRHRTTAESRVFGKAASMSWAIGVLPFLLGMPAMGEWLLYIAAGLTVVAFADYFWHYMLPKQPV